MCTSACAKLERCGWGTHHQPTGLDQIQAWNLSHFWSDGGEFASASQETENKASWIWSNPEGWWQAGDAYREEGAEEHVPLNGSNYTILCSFNRPVHVPQPLRDSVHLPPNR